MNFDKIEKPVKNVRIPDFTDFELFGSPTGFPPFLKVLVKISAEFLSKFTAMAQRKIWVFGEK